MKDVDYIKKQWTQYLDELREDWQKFENSTLKDYTRRGCDILERMIDNKILDIKPENIGNHLVKTFRDIGLIKENHESWIYQNLPEDFKRKYSKSVDATQFIEKKWRVVDDTDSIIEVDQMGNVRKNGIELVEKKQKGDRQETKPNAPDEYSVILKTKQETASKIDAAYRTIIDRYYSDAKANKIIKDYFKDFKKELKNAQDVYAKILNSTDVLDERNKWGDYEKSMGFMLMEEGETIAHIAKLMDYSSKFGSIGILKNPELQRKMKQLGECPKCHGNIYFEINERLKQAEIQGDIYI